MGIKKENVPSGEYECPQCQRKRVIKLANVDIEIFHTSHFIMDNAINVNKKIAKTCKEKISANKLNDFVETAAYQDEIKGAMEQLLDDEAPINDIKKSEMDELVSIDEDEEPEDDVLAELKKYSLIEDE